MNEEISSTHEKLKSLADHLVESALSDASFELAAHLSPNMSVASENIPSLAQLMSEKVPEVKSASATPREPIDVTELEHTVDSLNRKVQELLMQSQQTSYTYKPYYSVPKKSDDVSSVKPSEESMTDSARKAKELANHVSGVIDKISSKREQIGQNDKILDKTVEEEEYEELASRVQQIFERESSQIMDCSFNNADATNLNSSYFTKGGPDGSFNWTEDFLRTSKNADDVVTQTMTTVESTHTGSVDAETPRNLPNETIGSWTPRRLLVNQPHSSGVYGSKSNISLNDTSLRNESTYAHDYSLNNSTAFITESVDDFEYHYDKSLNDTSHFVGSVMSIVTESCNSSFFRDMNDSLYSPERDLRRADIRRSPSRKREKLRRSREDLSQCFELDKSDNSEPTVMSSKPLSHFYPSSRNVVERTRNKMDNDNRKARNPKLTGLWEKFPKAGKGENRTGKTTNPKSSRDEIDCFSQLICNPVQYFARQWLEGVKEAANLSLMPESDFDTTSVSDAGKKFKTQGTEKPSRSWLSRKASEEENLKRNVAPMSEVQHVASSAANRRVKIDKEGIATNNIQRVTGKPKSRAKKSNSNEEMDEVLVCESKRTVSVQTSRELMFGYQSEMGLNGVNFDNALRANENIKTRKETKASRQIMEAANLKSPQNTLSWFFSLSDKENEEENVGHAGRPKQLPTEMKKPRGTSKLTLQDAFLLNKADVLRKSRERQRLISIRAAERHMQEIYEHKRANINMSTRGSHGLPAKTKVLDAIQARDSPRWASVIPVRDCNNAKKKPITRSEMRSRTERLYQSLPEVKERDRLYKHKGQIQSNRIMLDSYKAKLKDQQLSKTTRSKTLVVRHY